MRAAAWLVLGVACAVEEPTTVPSCEGGGAAAVELGQGNLNFVPWEEGDTVPVELSGNYGFWMTLRTRGLDTREAMSVFLRFTIGAETETTDVGALLTLACQDDDTGNATVFATLGDDHQTAETVAGVDGEPLDLTVTLTDAAEETASAEIGLFLGAP